MESKSITNEETFYSRDKIVDLYFGLGLEVTEISDGYGFNHEYIAEVLSSLSVEIQDGFYIVESKMNYLDNRKTGINRYTKNA